jgi:hypothetical protein
MIDNFDCFNLFLFSQKKSLAFESILAQAASVAARQSLLFLQTKVWA